MSAGAVLKKYAEQYCPNLFNSSHLETNFDAQDVVKVYTDGACKANGRADSRGGIGVYWADNHPLFDKKSIS